jgi:phosphate transport system permease protein
MTPYDIHPGAGRDTRPAQRRHFYDTIAQQWSVRITYIPLIVLGCVAMALVIRAWPIVQAYPITELLFGITWKPSNGQFGLWPFITSTIWVTGLGVLLAVPPSLLAAFYLSEYAHTRTRMIIKPILDVLAAIPPVVYGVWGLLAVVPFVEEVIAPVLTRLFGSFAVFAVNQPTGFSVMAGSIVLAVMITPLMIAVISEILHTVPQEIRQASLAVGATRWETISLVLLPHITPGIIAAVVLGASRAFGETIAVLMVVGNVPHVPTSVFDTAYPLPALIANNYGEMMSVPLYDAALLAVALVLFIVVFGFNLMAMLTLRRFVRT